MTNYTEEIIKEKSDIIGKKAYFINLVVNPERNAKFAVRKGSQIKGCEEKIQDEYLFNNKIEAEEKFNELAN